MADTEVTLEDTAANLGTVAKYFGGNLAKFRKEWEQLTLQDKTQIRNGIGNGSFSY